MLVHCISYRGLLHMAESVSSWHQSTPKRVSTLGFQLIMRAWRVGRQARAAMEKQQHAQQEAAKQEAAQFKARPLPASSSLHHPGFFPRAASAQPLTIPEPFQLASETRHHEVLM